MRTNSKVWHEEQALFVLLPEVVKESGRCLLYAIAPMTNIITCLLSTHWSSLRGVARYEAKQSRALGDCFVPRNDRGVSGALATVDKFFKTLNYRYQIDNRT